MSKSTIICGVVLTDIGYRELENWVKDYVREGKEGKYIYCRSAVQVGNFVELTILLENKQPKEEVVISIPLEFVKFMARGENEISMGFASFS